jgi:hypothetical protein
MTQKLTVFLLLLTLSINLIGQNKKQPKNLEECYAILDSIIPEAERVEIQKSENLEVMSKYHMSIGLFIRNNWIRNGNKALIEQINPEHYKVGIDDIGSVVLTGYWYYIHKRPYSWKESLELASKYYESYEAPDPLSNPEKKQLEMLNKKLFVEGGKYTEVIHVYKISNENSYYIFLKSKGWCKLTEKEYQAISNTKDRGKLVDSLYEK